MAAVRICVNFAVFIVAKGGVDALLIHHIVSAYALYTSANNIVFCACNIVGEASLILQVESLGALVAKSVDIVDQTVLDRIETLTNHQYVGE